jgi:DNA-binding response OmpR family regulator
MRDRPHPPTFILVAEDDVAYGSTLCQLLRQDGHAVRLVHDGEDAIRVLRTEGHRLSLVLTDLLLPRRSGFQVAREALEAGIEAPVLVMTGLYDDMRDIHALRTLGVRGWIHKSVPFDQLLFRVNSLLWPATANERRSSRVAVSVPVQFRLDERVHYATSFNLSATGVYVRTPEPVMPGAEIEVALSLPTAREMVSCKAEIVHSATVDEVRGTAYPAGFGARFLELSPLASAAIRRYVESVEQQDDALVAVAAEPVLAHV